MHRLLVSSSDIAQVSPVLTHDAAAHLKVVRPEEGEEIELFDGQGLWRRYRWQAASKTLVAAGAPQRAARPRVPLTLFACVTKGSRWDWTLEKATELGVTRIVPVISARTIVRIPAEARAAKQSRWQRIVEDAARQSDAQWLPEILAPVDFAASLAYVRETTCLVGALTVPPPRTVGEVLRETVPCAGGFAAYVGPEGDFTPDELHTLLMLAIPTSFGTTVLRAETAAIYAVSAIKAFQDVSAR